MPRPRKYIAIDLKSFYASVECVERGLDPLDTCLVVADESRTPKTICLAVSPALKAYGTGGRPRLFEVVQKVNEANRSRGHLGKSFSAKELALHPEKAIDFITATPRMAYYIEYSTKIYEIYLRFIAPEDIHVYSIDEVFIDATSYLDIYKMNAHDLAMRMIRTVLQETGITATAGIGENLYLSKVAMDIMAKKMMPDKYGVRIAELDEMSYRRELWEHFPLTDFWRVGAGIARRLSEYSIFTMGDIAMTSLRNEALLYRLLGVNAELLIDHAWGWEPVTIEQIKAYKPETKSINSGQVLQRPYEVYEARNVILEMADAVSFDLLDKGLVTDQIVLTIGYDVESLSPANQNSRYVGKIKRDRYGRDVPVHSQGTKNFEFATSSANILIEKTGELFDEIVNPDLLIRRLNLSINRLTDEKEAMSKKHAIQLDLFSDYKEATEKNIQEKINIEKEHQRQLAILELRKKFGKNIIIRGLNLADGATQKERNRQIGGHKA